MYRYYRSYLFVTSFVTDVHCKLFNQKLRGQTENLNNKWAAEKGMNCVTGLSKYLMLTGYPDDFMYIW